MKKFIAIQLLAFSASTTLCMRPPLPPGPRPLGNAIAMQQAQREREENIKEAHLLQQQEAEEDKERAEELHLQQEGLRRNRQEADARDHAARLRFRQEFEEAERFVEQAVEEKFRLKQEALAKERSRQEEAKERRSQRVKYPRFYKKVLWRAQSLRQQQENEPQKGQGQRPQPPLAQYVEMVQQQEDQGYRERAARDNEPIEYTPQSIAHLIRRLPMPLLFTKLLPVMEKYLGQQHTFLTPQAPILVKRILAYPTTLQWPWSNYPERTIEHPQHLEDCTLLNRRAGAVFCKVRQGENYHYPPLYVVDIVDTGNNVPLCTLNMTDLCHPHFSDASPDKSLIFTLTHCIDGGIPYVDIWDSSTGQNVHRLNGQNGRERVKNITVVPDKQSILVTYTNDAARMFQVDNYNIEAFVHQENAEILRKRAKKIPLFPAVAQQEINRGVAGIKASLLPADRSRAYDRITKALNTGKGEARIALAADIGFGGLPSHY